MLKKILTLSMALLLVLGTVAATETSTDEYLPGYYKPPVENEGQYPIAEKDVTLTYWMPINSGAANFIDSYAENPAYQAIQRNTGVTIDFIHPAAGMAQETFNLMIASGDLPDLIQIPNGRYYDGDLMALYEDGAIIDLAPYLEEYAPQYLDVINHTEMAQRQIIQDGKVLGFYKITFADPMPYVRFNVNKDWLDEFGMDEPVTIDEYEAFFQAVLDNKPGVTPMWFSGSIETYNLLMGAYDMLASWYLDPDGVTARYWANAPQYKEFLTLLHSWYEKGFLSKDFASLQMTEAQAMFDAGQLACIADSVDASYSRTKDLFPVTNLPYMRKEADSVIGNNLATWAVDESNQWVTMITSACDNIEAAVQYLNYGYTFEGSQYFTFGVEGEAWNWGDDGLPVYTDLILNNPQGMTISNVSYAIKIHFGSRYCYPDSIGHPGVASNKPALEVRTLWADDKNEQSYLRLPPIMLTTAESNRRSELLAEIDTYAEEMRLKFIVGAESLDNYDAYLEELENLGLSEAILITQTALDRFFE